MLADKLFEQIMGILQLFEKLLATAVGIFAKHGQRSLVLARRQ